MLINLSELFIVEGKEKIYSQAFEIEKFQVESDIYDVSRKTPIGLTIKNIGDRNLFLQGQVTVTLKMFCGRCLDIVEQTFDLDFERLLNMNLSEEERREALDEQPYLNGYELDVDQLVCNELLLNLPMKVLCDESCKGVCNRCGTNLNHETCDCDSRSLDPRMSVIQDIFKRSKEV